MESSSRTGQFSGPKHHGLPNAIAVFSQGVSMTPRTRWLGCGVGADGEDWVGRKHSTFKEHISKAFHTSVPAQHSHLISCDSPTCTTTHPTSTQCAHALLSLQPWLTPFLSFKCSSQSCPLPCKPGVLSDTPPPWCLPPLQSKMASPFSDDLITHSTKSSPSKCRIPFLLPTSPKPFREGALISSSLHSAVTQ